MRLLIVLFLVVLFAGVACEKTNTANDAAAVDNCDGLVTDTAGTHDDAYVVMANAFTPNGDGNNDAFFPIFRNIATYDFKVYDAANAIVFATTSFGQAWAPAIQYTTNQTFYCRVQAVTKENHKIGVCGEVRLLTCVPRDSLKYIYFADQCDPNGKFVLPTADKIAECP